MSKITTFTAADVLSQTARIGETAELLKYAIEKGLQSAGYAEAKADALRELQAQTMYLAREATNVAIMLTSAIEQSERAAAIKRLK